jgi:RNA polymerase sigma-70 factor (ECF subfamily)
MPWAREAFRLATYWTGNPVLAEDIIQEALLRAWRSRRRLYRHAKPQAWFLTVVRHLVHDHHRGRGRRPMLSLVEVTAVMDRRDPYDAAEDRVALAAGLRRLSERDQELLAWRFGLDLSFEEIARRTGLPVSTVKSRVYRALQRLRTLAP